MNTPRIIIITIIAATLTGCSHITEEAPTQIQPQQTQHTNTSSDSNEQAQTPTTSKITPSTNPEVPAVFNDFSFEIPSDWQIEYLPDIEALNIYDPSATADTSLEQSQILIRHFTANEFLTLQTVDILERTELTINSRPAVRYDIEKKPGVTNFPGQPSWRNTQHIVTDIRKTDTNPSTFYVIAKNPSLDDTTYETLLDSVEFK